MADGVYWDRAKETRSRAEREAEVLANLQNAASLRLRDTALLSRSLRQAGLPPG